MKSQNFFMNLERNCVYECWNVFIECNYLEAEYEKRNMFGHMQKKSYIINMIVTVCASLAFPCACLIQIQRKLLFFLCFLVVSWSEHRKEKYQFSLPLYGVFNLINVYTQPTRISSLCCAEMAKINYKFHVSKAFTVHFLFVVNINVLRQKIK